MELFRFGFMGTLSWVTSYAFVCGLGYTCCNGILSVEDLNVELFNDLGAGCKVWIEICYGGRIISVVRRLLCGKLNSRALF